MDTIQLNSPIPVTITSSLPIGVKSKTNSGWCYAWVDTGIDAHRLWVVIMDDTGEVVDVPQPEILVDMNWSYQRRIPKN